MSGLYRKTEKVCSRNTGNVEKMFVSETHKKITSHEKLHPPVHVCRQRSGHGDPCQSSDMATLFNSLSFVFKILFLPKYRVEYYDYIVKWCSGIM